MGKQFEQSRGGSFRGAGRGGSRGGSSRGGPHRGFDQGPPSYVVPFATFVHRVQGNFLVKSSDPSRFPKFNRGVYLESKAKVGSVDQILGPVSAYYFSINPAEGVNPSSFQSGQVFYMNPQDLLSTDRVTKPQARMPRGPGGFAGRGGARGGARGGFSHGGRGGSDRGRGGNDRGRGAPRGRGFGGRGR